MEVSSASRELPRRLAEARQALQADASREYGAASYFSGADMLNVMLHAITMSNKTIDGMQYCIDHTTGVVMLIAQMYTGVKVRLLLDKSNFYRSSCARQAERVYEIYYTMGKTQNGEIRIMSGRTTTGFAMMHCKSWIIDKKICLLGSVNLTHNGLENNTENLLRVLEPECVQMAGNDFDTRWDEAEVVDDDMIKKMMDNDAAKKEKAEDDRRNREDERRSRSNSRPRADTGRSSSRARSSSRSLAPQFASVVEEIG